MTAKALLTLLAEEKAALLGGRLDTLPAYQEEKARLATVLETRGADANSLDAVRSAVEENHRLLGLALTACRSASDRLGSLQQRARTVGYTAAGGRLTHTDQAVERGTRV
ncbi:hypothetical protein [Parvularcula dongshanensis]|uniref:Flagellar protein FlgN n=1 Tax=Parvularcula dongshanensis TaxID=1173995 RepID=A0A840I4D3_9PROT|nr:hypothetical protein [Parvularcula dongshanensis]MBB4659637.1 hypothetical protein [Parvularcula dongshanensis]